MKKGFLLTLLALVLMASVIVLPSLYLGMTERTVTESSSVDKSKHNIVSQPDQTSEKTPEVSVITRDDTVTFLIELEEKSLIDTVIASNGKYGSVKELLMSEEGKSCCDAIKKSQAVAKAGIRKLITRSDLTGSKVLSAVMNGLTIRAPLSSREKLEKINGVKAVYVFYGDYRTFDNDEDSSASSPVPEEEVSLSETSEIKEGSSPNEEAVGEGSSEAMDPNAATPAVLTGLYQDALHLTEAYDSGYDGSGMLIAVLDSEFDLQHEVFSAAPLKTGTTKADVQSLMKQVTFNTASSYSGDQLYRSGKIVFAYDYAEDDNDTADPSLNHGTSVASAAAGNNGRTDENAFRGTAYQAQLALMKVADKAGSDGAIRIEKNIMLAALDDAVKLGADVISLSFGSYELPDNEDLMNSVLEKLGKTDTLLICAEGNAGYSGQETIPDVKPDTRDIHYGTENRLGAADGVLCAGSADNGWKIRHFMTAHSQEITYRDRGSVSLYDRLGDTDLPYLFTDTDGAESDYEGLEAAGRLIIVRQGEIPIETLAQTAYLKDAAALGIIGAPSEEIGGLPSQFPVILIDAEQEAFFENEPAGSVTLYSYSKLYQESETIRVSSFNSYHFGSDLQFTPQLLAPGESVCTAAPEGGYRLQTGTSVTAPCVAGYYTLVKQYFLQNGYFKNTDKVTLRHQVSAAMLSSGNVLSSGSGRSLYESPRLQGSGIADWQQLVNAGAFLSTEDGEPAVISLGDGERSRYQFSFCLTNYSDEEKTYTACGVLQTDGCTHLAGGIIRSTLKPTALGGFSIRIAAKGQTSDKWTVPAHGRLTLEAVITVDQQAAQSRLDCFPNGYFIDGYVFVEEEQGATRLNLPFMGFYGDWDGTDPFDSTVYEDENSISGERNTLVAAAVKDKSYSAVPLAQCEKGLAFSRESIRYAEDDPSYGYAFILPDLYPLCDIDNYTVTMKDSTGQTIFTELLGNFSSYRDPNYRFYEKMAEKFYESEKLFAPLKDGIYEYILTAQTQDAYGRLAETYRKSFPIVIDSEAPADLSSRTYAEDDKIYLQLSASDNNAIAGFRLYSAVYRSSDKSYHYTDQLSDLIKAGYISEDSYRLVSRETDKKGRVTFLYEITDLRDELSKLGIRTGSWSSKSSDLKIVYRAFDSAGNSSEAQTADTIVYGSAKFCFTDQNGIPAEGITVTLGNQQKTTDKTGEAVFSDLVPGDYFSVVSYDESLYDLSVRESFVTIRTSQPNCVENRSVVFKGEYPPEGSSDQEPDSSEGSGQQASSRLNADDPIYALILIGTLLLICIISLVMRQNRRRGNSRGRGRSDIR